MQTFVPLSSSFPDCAAVLDMRRLGKQRVDVLQIYHSLGNLRNHWHNHPAVRMWRGAEAALLLYGVAICEEWLKRGYLDSTLERMQEHLSRFAAPDRRMPPWWGDERVHASHRAALLTKLPQHYSQFGWTEAPKLDYYWPGGY